MWGIPGWMKRDRAEINRDKEAAIRRRTCLILFLSLFIYPLSAVLSWSNTQACTIQCTYSFRHSNDNRAGAHIPSILSLANRVFCWLTRSNHSPCLLSDAHPRVEALSAGMSPFPPLAADSKRCSSPTLSHLTTCLAAGLEINEASPWGVGERSCLALASHCLKKPKSS